MMAKAWMKQDQAPQAEALETWNTLEAEFNEERKAMLMASAETDAIKEAMNKKFGSGTIKYGSEIKQPEIKTPQAIFEFSQRNPAAEGGRMLNAVQMGEAMGNRTGFATPRGAGIPLSKEQLQLLKDNLTKEEFKKLKFGEPTSRVDNYDIGVKQRIKKGDKYVKNPLWRKVTNILNPGKASSGVKILNNEKLSNALIKSTNAGNSIETIITKMNKLDKTLSRNSISSAINALVARGQIDEEFGRVAGKDLTIGDQQAYNKIIEEAVDEGKLNRAQIARKAGVSDSVVEDWIKKNKGDDFYKKNFDYETGRLKTGNLQTRKDLFEFVENSDKITAKEISERFNLDSKKTQTTLSDLVGDIYRMRTREGGSIVVPYDEPDRLKNVLDKIRDAPDFEDIYQRRIGDLVASAYPKGSKAQKQAMKSLSEYYKFSRALKEKFPELALSLDHVVPFQFLKEVKQGENPINLIKVKPTVSAVNRFKTNFDNARIELNRLNKIDPNNPDVKKRLKILNDLQKNIGIEFGGTSKGGYVYNFGAQPVGKSNLVGDAKKAIYDYQKVGKFSEKVLADEKLQKQLIEAGVDTGKDMAAFEKITPFSDKEFRQIIKVIGCPNFGKAGGGRIEFSEGKDCFDKGQKLINNGMKGASPAALKNLAKLGPMLLKAGSAAMSGLIAPEAVIVGLEAAARVGMGDTPSEAILRATDYLTPDSFFGDFIQKADLMKIERTLGKDVKNIAAQSFDRTNQLDEINKLEEKLKNLEAMTESGDFGYVGDLTNQINMTKNQIKEKKDKLKNTAQIGQEGRDFYTQQAMENAYDASMAKSKSAEKRLADSQSENPRLSAAQAMQDMKSQEQLNKNISMRLPLTGSRAETDFLNASQLPMGPRMPSEIDLITAGANKKFKNMGSDKRVTSQDLKLNQDRKQMFKDASIEELVNMGLPLEAILGFNIAQPIERTGPGYKTNYKPLDRFGSQERPVLYPNNRGTLAEGGITGLRSKYEYKK